jgi:hypothetical protein
MRRGKLEKLDSRPRARIPIPKSNGRELTKVIKLMEDR